MPTHFILRSCRRDGIAQRAFVLLTLALAFASGCGKPKKDAPPPVLETEKPTLSRISERPGSVRLEGIGPIRGFARGRDCTFIHCLELVLDALGRPYTYDQLMGYSGMAFRVQFRTDRWDVGNPDPVVGETCLDSAFAATGFNYDLRIVRRDELSAAAALRGEIAESIDRGNPVLAANIIRPEDWGIIVGYRADQQWLCRSYNGGALSSDRLANGWPTAVVLLGKRMVPPPKHEAQLAAIRRAIDLFQRRQTGRYMLGAAAFDTWATQLRRADDRSYIHPNIWTYVCLMDARASAVRFLREVAGDFGPTGKHVLAAADFYDRELQLLQDGYRFVPAERTYPNTLPPPELRDRQIETLLRAKNFEEQAIAELEKATHE